MSFNKKVLKLLKEKKKTKAELAKAAGIPYTTLDSMLKRDSDTTRLATIFKIAQYLDVSVEELVFDGDFKTPLDDLSFSDEERILISDFRQIDERGKNTVLAALHHEVVLNKRFSDFEDISETVTNFNTIPVYNAPAAAGDALPFITDDYIMVNSDKAPANASFGIRISGDSMEPAISDGSVVWVRRQETLNNGEIGIFILNGESLCKKYENIGGKCRLISVNKKYHSIEVYESDDLRVVGRVIEL